MNLRPIVIKFGGEIVERDEDLENLAQSILALHQQGETIILVHGGGPLASKISKEMGIFPQMVGGRRVTCNKTLNIMKMVLPGIINSNILAKLHSHKIPAAAASAITFVSAHKRAPKVMSGTEGEKVDYGLVGDVDIVSVKLLTTLIEENFIPVVSPLSLGDNEQILNINADTIATQIALATNAKKLVLITKIGGVYLDIKNSNSRFSVLSISEARDQINKKIVQDGMIPKLEEGFKLLEQQLKEFHIVGVHQPDTLLKELNNPGSQGTVIRKD